LKQNSPFQSIKITPPFGGVFCQAIALLLLVVLIGELVIRTGVGFKLWPEPLLGSINAELDIKVQTLDVLAKNETIDCIFLGSSQMDAAINPDVFSAEYQRLTGRKINCFNFSLGTLTSGPAGTMAKLLVHRYQPNVLFLGISARDFSRDYGELSRSFKDDPWVKYSLGEQNIPGWLIENSLFFRFFSQLRAQLNPDYVDFHTGLLRSIRPNGYLYREGNELSNNSALSMPEYELFFDDLVGLDEILALNNENLRVVVLEIPVFPGFFNSYVEGDQAKYFSLFRSPIQDRIHEKGIPFILSQEMATDSIPDTYWNDILHLNYRGTEIFSTWVAQKTVEVLSSSNSVEKTQ
jgi:hypothetical protein